MTRYRSIPLAVCAAILVAAAAPSDSYDKEFAATQGTWTLVSGMKDGKPIDAGAVKGATLVIKDNTFRITHGVGTASEGTFRIDPTKSPKWLDSTSSGDRNTTETWLGIYEIDGDIETVCLAPPGKDRPTKFASPEGSGFIFHVWQREKAE